MVWGLSTNGAVTGRSYKFVAFHGPIQVEADDWFLHNFLLSKAYAQQNHFENQPASAKWFHGFQHKAFLSTGDTVESTVFVQIGLVSVSSLGQFSLLNMPVFESSNFGS
jgi:hypothetical protein